MYPTARFVRQTQCKPFQNVLQLHFVLIESWAFENSLRVGSGRNQGDKSKFGADEGGPQPAGVLQNKGLKLVQDNKHLFNQNTISKSRPQ